MKHAAIRLSILLIVVAIFAAGCAYYNTFYNAKKKFNEAERDNRNPTTTQNRPAQQGNLPQTTTPQRNVQSPEKYRKVVETCSKLLEFYPKSRWVDDALYLMGVSYYRLGELSRAERKFAELQTLFPKSRHIPAAVLFLGHTYVEQKNLEGAVDLLTKGLTSARAGRDKAAMHLLLGEIYRDQKRWSDAAEQFQTVITLRPSRDVMLEAQYELGLAKFNSGMYEDARDAMSRVARLATDWSRAYDAFIYWSRSEARMQNYEFAEGILRRVESSPKYTEFSEEIPLELAAIALEAGNPDKAVNLYQEYVQSHPQGEFRGMAYYRLALINRDQLIDLPRAKAYLDSAVQSGGKADFADSARLAQTQLSKGLLAIDQIKEIENQLSARRESTEEIIPDSEFPDSSRIDIEGEPASGGVAVDSADSAVTTRRSPAALAADSIARALRIADSLAKDTALAAETDTMGIGMAMEDTASSPDEEVTSAAESAKSETVLRRELHQAYLHIAEFYQYGLADADSALRYYRLAASLKNDPSAYWKANLFLGEYLSKPNEVPTAEAVGHFRNVVEADSVPLDAQNMAREALQMPLIELPIPPQKTALRSAEESSLNSTISPDSLLNLYSHVISYDSASPEGQAALFAKAQIYEVQLAEFDSARAIFQKLLELFPNASFADRLRSKLAPPDSLIGQYFAMTREEIIGKRAPLEDLLETSPDSSGWPPPEESLEGRKFQ